MYTRTHAIDQVNMWLEQRNKLTRVENEMKKGQRKIAAWEDQLARARETNPKYSTSYIGDILRLEQREAMIEKPWTKGLNRHIEACYRLFLDSLNRDVERVGRQCRCDRQIVHGSA